MRRTTLLAIACICLSTAWSMAADAKTEKQTFVSGGAKHAFYVFVPDNPASQPAPLLLLLHGSGRDGRSLLDPWLPLAKSEGIVLVAPDASDPRAWRIPEEGPDFIHDLIELVSGSHAIDRHRMYVFGHSAGAIHGLDLGLLESEYFAAVAVHAGTVSPALAPLLDQVARKIPMAIWVGTNDASFPLADVRRTRDVLNARGFDVRLTEIKNHTHDYYGSAASINKEAWAFLHEHTLESEPKFQSYQITK
jgi:poly(3-hydroxybutyrate) depolymerase